MRSARSPNSRSRSAHSRRIKAMMAKTTIRFRATSTNSVENLRDAFTALSSSGESDSPAAEAELKFLKLLNGRWNRALGRDFETFALPHQLPPALANDGDPWTTWLLLGGRGAGKTRAGAEWVRRLALADGTARIALIAETEHD